MIHFANSAATTPNPPVVPDTRTATEVESFCRVFSVEEKVASTAIPNLKNILGIHNPLTFSMLKGGNKNCPILVTKHDGNRALPFAVLKRESKPQSATARLRIIDMMQRQGCRQLPHIFKSKDNAYLVPVGKNIFSCMAYIKSDVEGRSLFTLDQMFELVRAFHAHSRLVPEIEDLGARDIDRYSDIKYAQLAPELMAWNSALFTSEAWGRCVKCARYFIQPSFRAIYNQLPVHVVHGDIHSGNVIVSNGQHFLVDFDLLKKDIRLLDFVTFAGSINLDEFLRVVEEGRLSSFIHAHYGNLEEIEEKYLPFIVLFGRCCALSWSLGVLKEAIVNKDAEKIAHFKAFVESRIHEIDRLYTHIPEIRAAIPSEAVTRQDLFHKKINMGAHIFNTCREALKRIWKSVFP